ncbi:mersacidin/lichenicidin family type 2 lantibiotic [Thermosporothrix hazakensis]|jgi:mersacidin/lichenicidin family type 2 lantibiotic|uniref:Mersacidin/lichenicidin family type 2 lantibiotic n=1 Tax=Thermosporothrix hazakensis TaxID=644383 RepID=A0A326U729_THEHA|nr:mersacidin/lichenicidin family type 2 lantibiotic [Thermosporothrix hazakensis]PZW29342.1 mersacidin/lichenicidin family type 2 lantibiotic [Thermosporothrix hazakensis]GCE45307.1 hypothetical protein KTH_01760 [Thermosporothrix hazakensis]
MHSTIIRAWKDARFRKQLSEEEKARLPESPVGSVTELSDEELGEVAGGYGSSHYWSYDWWRCRRRRSYYGGCRSYGGCYYSNVVVGPIRICW